MTKKFLDSVYNLDTASDVEEFYDDWASTYDAEVTDNGYLTPSRCADALWQFLPNPETRILDVGCGTGLSGEALAKVGYTNIDGIDPSAEMLAIAKRKGVYKTAIHMQGEEMEIEPGSYEAIACIGVIGVGAAPVTLLDTVMNLLPSGGKLVLSYNDKAIKERIYEARLNDYLDGGSARLLFRELGDHLPGKGMTSYVYVVEKV
ncbi:class I SAM-dependent methyltransferase [Cognatishimia sp.]|uniref:class I SAM-dependent DNA methyltransferase n=1 Tax=Cognatishimia sp. TaxID=2211648 RepID=UPI0035136ED6|nr:class I SAM-dependent methyltransferase [Cognatishimia sp.]